MDDARKCSGNRPKRKTCGEDEVDVQSVNEPAGKKLRTGVGPEKGREEETESGGGEGELALEDEDG